jgi:aminopeptidase N
VLYRRDGRVKEADARKILVRALQSLATTTDRYGPYPYRVLSFCILEAGRGFSDAREYPGFILLLLDHGYSPTTHEDVAHEIGHQWFYGLVGNDQGRDPWLDEGLASWAQGRAGFPYPRRPIPPAARGHMGASMTYWDRHGRAYGAGVYAQSVAALESLGTPEKVDCALRAYVARNAYSIAQPADLLAALRRFFPRAEAVLRRFGVRP